VSGTIYPMTTLRFYPQLSPTMRVFDFLLAVVLIAFLAIPMLLLAVLIKFSSPGPVLYWSDRVGRNNSLFKMPKFRTMKVETPAVATHLLTAPDRYVTRIGRILRRYSLDELPQLFSVLKGDMRFVGPRPALFNQDDLVELRTRKGIHRLLPGITGWAQINGRDDLPIPVKVTLDEYYLNQRSFTLDLKIVFATIFSALTGKGVRH
jgi:O-antigen biosynthesis protein WbqP